MTRIIVALVAASACVLAVVPIHSQTPAPGPFGLRKGTSRAELEKTAGPLREEQPGVYTATRVPSPDAGFNTYGLVITPRSGLCGVVAGGKLLDIDPQGTQIRAAFSSMRDALSRTYGASPAVWDQLQAGATLTKPADWAQSLAARQRVLHAVWRVKSNPGRVRTIELSAGAMTPSKALLWLTYTFDFRDGCVDELKALRRASVK